MLMKMLTMIFEQLEDQSREKFEQIHEEFEEERWALEKSLQVLILPELR